MMNSKGRVKDLVQKLNDGANYDDDFKKMIVECETEKDSFKIFKNANRKKRSHTESKIPNRKIGFVSNQKTSREENLHLEAKKSNLSGLESLPYYKELDEDNGILNSWTKMMGIETLYILLSKKHVALQNAYRELQNHAKLIQEKNISIEKNLEKNHTTKTATEDNNCSPNVDEIQKFQKRESDLIAKIQELQEQNELLEFRLLEVEGSDSHNSQLLKNNVNHEEYLERDDKSDSGVILFSPYREFSTDSDDSNQELLMDEERSKSPGNDLIEKLCGMLHYLDNVMDRTYLHQAVELIRRYEMRITSLEATITNMCQEKLERNFENSEPLKYSMDVLRSNRIKTPRIIATVPPFTNRQTKVYSSDDCNTGSSSPLKNFFQDVNCLNESGIFDEFIEFDYYPEYKSEGTQTDAPTSPSSEFMSFTELTNFSGSAELTTELNKLNKIKERLENHRRKSPGRKLAVADGMGPDNNFQNTDEGASYIKYYHFYREQYEKMQNKILIYESSDDIRIKELKSKFQKEFELDDQLKQFKEKVEKLENEKQKIEEEKCELEEVENDTRLRCQKLEVKLNALFEKKNDLQIELQQSARIITNLRNNLSDLEKKRKEAHEQSLQMEQLANQFEERNFVLEENFIDFRYKFQIFQTIVPLIIMWNLMDNKLPRSTKIPLCIEFPNNQKNITRKISVPKTKNFAIKIYGESVPRASNKFFINQSTNTENNFYQNIEELKFQEKIFQQTLQNADEMITAIEKEHSKKLKELENLLNEKNCKIEECERKIKFLSFEKEQQNQLTEKSHNLEFELENLRNLLKTKEEEKQSRLAKEKILMEEIDNLNSTIQQLKDDENILKKKLDFEKNLLKQQRKELEFKQAEFKESENKHNLEIKKWRNQMLRLTKEIENQEVTNGELKEEVETLENVVQDMRDCLNRERDEKEKSIIELSLELSKIRKDMDILRSCSQDKKAINAAEEMKQLKKSKIEIPLQKTNSNIIGNCNQKIISDHGYNCIIGNFRYDQKTSIQQPKEKFKIGLTMANSNNYC